MPNYTHEVVAIPNTKLFKLAKLQEVFIVYDRGKHCTDQLKGKLSDLQCNHNSLRKVANALGGEYNDA